MVGRGVLGLTRDPGRQVLRRHRAGEVEALAELAAERGQERPGGAVLDAFGDALQAKALRKLDRGADDGRVALVVRNVLDQVAVDLELIRGQIAQPNPALPAPKSSIATRTPMARSRASTSFAASGSTSTAVSVTSMASTRGDKFALASSWAT